LRDTLQKLDEKAEIYLFGSRVDDLAKGGDIDLLIHSRHLNRQDLRRLKLAFYDAFGEQKIDIVLDDGQKNDPFLRLIRTQAVPL